MTSDTYLIASPSINQTEIEAFQAAMWATAILTEMEI